MKTTQSVPHPSLGFRTIPTARRHIYFYSMLVLVAVVLSNMKERVIGTTAEDTARAKQSAAKIVGTQLVNSIK